MEKHVYDEADLDDMTEGQKKTIKQCEKLAKEILGEKYENFTEYMKNEVVVIRCTRLKTEIELTEVSKTELLDIIFPNIMSRLLSCYKNKDKAAVLLKVMNKVEGKENPLWEDED